MENVQVYGSAIVGFVFEEIKFTATREKGQLVIYTNKPVTGEQLGAARKIAEDFFERAHKALEHSMKQAFRYEV